MTPTRRDGLHADPFTFSRIRLWCVRTLRWIQFLSARIQIRCLWIQFPSRFFTRIQFLPCFKFIQLNLIQGTGGNGIHGRKPRPALRFYGGGGLGSPPSSPPSSPSPSPSLSRPPPSSPSPSSSVGLSVVVAVVAAVVAVVAAVVATVVAVGVVGVVAAVAVVGAAGAVVVVVGRSVVVAVVAAALALSSHRGLYSKKKNLSSYASALQEENLSSCVSAFSGCVS